MIRHVAVAALTVALAGCMLGPNYSRPELDLPAEYHVPIDPGTVRVFYRRQPPVDITERIKPFITDSPSLATMRDNGPQSRPFQGTL